MDKRYVSTEGNHYLFTTFYAKIDDVVSFCRKQMEVSSLDYFALIEHNKDTKKNGKEAKPHIHCLLHYTNERSASGVSKNFAQANYLQIDGNPSVLFYGAPIIDKSSAYSYLTHSVNFDNSCDTSVSDDNGFNSKYIYDEKDIIQSEGAKEFFNKNPLKQASSDRATDNSYLILKDMIEDKIDYLELVKTYGKDLVYHYTQFKAIKKDIVSKPELDDLIVVNSRLKVKIEVLEEQHSLFCDKYEKTSKALKRYKKAFEHIKETSPAFYRELIIIFGDL